MIVRKAYLLTAGELELGTPEGLDDTRLVPIAGPHTHDRLANVHSGDSSLRLAERTSHPSLESTHIPSNMSTL